MQDKSETRRQFRGSRRRLSALLTHEGSGSKNDDSCQILVRTTVTRIATLTQPIPTSVDTLKTFSIHVTAATPTRAGTRGRLWAEGALDVRGCWCNDCRLGASLKLHRSCAPGPYLRLAADCGLCRHRGGQRGAPGNFWS